jgi:hypothetical protein
VTSTIPRHRQYLRGLTVIVAAAVAGMIALSGQNAEASALPTSSSHSSAVTLNVASHQDASRAEHKKKHHQKLDQKKHPKQKHAKQQQSSSGAGQNLSGTNAQGTNAERQAAVANAAAKQAAQQAAAQQTAAANTVAAAKQAAAKAQAAAVKQAKAAKAAAAARKALEQARIKAAKASDDAVLSAAVATAVSPILGTTQVDTGSPSQSTVTGPTTSAQKAAQAKPATGASANKRPNTAAIRPLPTQLVWIGHVTSGIEPILLAAFVLVFGFGLVLGGTTRRMAHRTR